MEEEKGALKFAAAAAAEGEEKEEGGLLTFPRRQQVSKGAS